MKVVHQKFTPISMSKKMKKIYRHAQNALYPVSETEEVNERIFVAQAS